MLDKMVEDDIPNIRFNVAKTYNQLIRVLRRLPEDGTLYSVEKDGNTAEVSPRGAELIEQRIMPNLEKLQKDEDVDVRYFATTAGKDDGSAANAPAGLSGAAPPAAGAATAGEPMNTSP